MTNWRDGTATPRTPAELEALLEPLGGFLGAQALLTWAPPEPDRPIELTLSAAIALTTNGSSKVFNTAGNGTVYGSGPGGAGGGISGCTIQLTSLGVGGAVAFESSTDGVNYSALTVTSVADGSTTTTTANAPGGWFVATNTKTQIRVRATSLTSGTIRGSIHGNSVTGMLANQDYILYCPVPITLNYPNIGAVKMSGGRNVIWIGGEIQVPYQNLSGSDTYSRAIYTEYATGIVHLEGLYIHGVDCSDGFQLYSAEAIIQIQNCRVGDPDQPITAHDLVAFSDKHPDVVEGEGGWRELRIDKLTGWSNYQGIFLNQVTAKHGRFSTIRRVDLNGAVDGVPTGSRQLFWQGGESGLTKLEEFYVQPHTEKTSLNFWNTLLTSCRPYGTTAEPDVKMRQIVYLPPGLVNPTDGHSPTSSRWVEESYWPPKPAATGHAKLGPPTLGEFVPDDIPGCSYVPMGYLHTDETKLFEDVASPPTQGRSIRPSMNKVKSWSMDPASATTSCAPVDSGRLYLTKMPIEDSLYETTGLITYVETAGVSLTSNQCFVAIVDRVGNTLAKSADMSTTFNSVGEKRITLTDVSPYTPMANYMLGGFAEFFFVLWLLNWTGSAPKFSAPFDNAGSDADDNARARTFNLGVDGTQGGIGPTGRFVTRFQKGTTGQTAVPTTVFFSSNKPSNFAPLVGFI